MYRGPRIRFIGLFPLLFFIIFFGRGFIFLALMLILIVAGIYIISKVVDALNNKSVNNNKYERKDNSYSEDSNLDKYFKGNSYLYLTDNISVKKDNGLFVYYKGEKISPYYEVIDNELEERVIRDINSNSIESISNKLEYSGFEYNKEFESSAVNKPEIANVSSYESRFEAFVLMLKNVDYGTSNSKEYVKGHINAIKKYLELSYEYQYDLSTIEDKLNYEIENDEPNESIEDKGYYDGLIYVLKALRKSKELIVERIKKEL